MQIYFLFGNQPLEIKEMVDELTAGLLPKADTENAVFSFDVVDFFTQERDKARNQFRDFQNTCQTVSFFSPEIVVQVNNLQKIPLKKSPADVVIKALKEISLVKNDVDGDSLWFDADSLVDRVETRHHITGFQIAEEIVHCGGKTFYLKLDPLWEKRLIHRQKGKGIEAVEFKSFLNERIKQNMIYELPEGGISGNESGTSDVLTILKSYIENPPGQVTFIFTANIRNTREINSEVYALLQQYGKEIKGTVAYDDFRPLSWVMKRAEKKQLAIVSDAADLLIEIAGTDFSILDMELEKLSLLYPPGTRITPDDLLQSVTHSKRFTIFRIADFLVQKDLHKTVESLEMILKDHPGESIGVFGLIASQFRRLLKIAWMAEKGVSEKNIISQLKINQWVAKQAIRHSRNFTRLELENIVVHLAKTDLQIKFFVKDALTIMENICFQICQGVFAEKRHIEQHWLP